jgi:hypothetical protein
MPELKNGMLFEKNKQNILKIKYISVTYHRSIIYLPSHHMIKMQISMIPDNSMHDHIHNPHHMNEPVDLFFWKVTQAYFQLWQHHRHAQKQPQVTRRICSRAQNQFIISWVVLDGPCLGARDFPGKFT